MDHQGIYHEDVLGLIEGAHNASDEGLCKIHSDRYSLDDFPLWNMWGDYTHSAIRCGVGRLVKRMATKRMVSDHKYDHEG